MTEQEKQNRLMDYLYDEMNDREKREFEKFLETQPRLKKELEEMQATRKAMATVSLDSAELEPFNFNPDQTSGSENSSKGSTKLYRLMKVGLAAAILLAGMMAIAFSGVQFGKTTDGFYLTIGNQPEPVQQGISEEDVMNLLTQIQQENTLLMAAMAEQSRQQQNEQLEEALNLLTTYYDQRRQQDLLLIAEGLTQLEEDTYYRFLQTDETIGDIIYALSNP
jgi:Tfp pilus assembly protein FimV